MSETSDQDIDWESIPQIKDDLRHLQTMRDNADDPVTGVGNMFREPGKEYLLKVRVTDVDLAQVVLTRAFSNNTRIPGMEILEVVFDPEGRKKQTLAEQLRQLANDIENQD